MPVYKRFEKNDIIHHSITTSPKITLASGSSGWRSNTGTSSSISLYGGLRSREVSLSGDGLHIQPFIEFETHDIDGTRMLSGSYPFSSSVEYIKLKINSTSEDRNDWGEKHWASISNLYDYYSRINADYVTSSYDYYCVFFDRNSNNKVRHLTTAGSSSIISKYNFTNAYTIEALVKPHTVNLGTVSYANGTNYITLVSDTNNRFSFFISGSKLAFSASDGSGVIRTSSLSVTKNDWQHVSYRVGSNQGTFTINLVDAGSYTVTGSLDTASLPDILIGSKAADNTSFHGMMHEVKLWKEKRTHEQLSASFNSVLNDSSSANLVLYDRFNDGPLSIKHEQLAGSGSIDYSVNMVHGVFQNFNRTAPIWLPNDNNNFTARKSLAEGNPSLFRIISIPSLFYGRQIATGSVKLTCNTYLSSSLMRTIVDDGRGGLYISGSMSSASLDTRTSYEGVKWNKVGNVFYSEGLIVLKNPSIVDIGDYGSTSAGIMVNDVLQLQFKGLQKIPSNTFMCRINGAEFNASDNPTYTTLNENTGRYEIIRETPLTYVTSVGLYNEEFKLVAVAKLAQPIRNREKDKINFKLRMDF